MENCPIPGLQTDVEDAWRQRLLDAKARYLTAVELHREEEMARGEYLKVLEIFSGFVLHGRALEDREPD